MGNLWKINPKFFDHFEAYVAVPDPIFAKYDDFLSQLSLETNVNDVGVGDHGDI